MEILTLPPASGPSESFLELQQLTADAVLFEQLIYRLLSERYDLKIGMFKEEEQLCVQVSANIIRRHVDRRDNDDSAVGMIFIPLAQLQKHYKPKLIPFSKTCEQGEESTRTWYEARDKRLRIRPDKWCGEQIAAASSLPELILSYALQDEYPMVEVKRELLHVNAGVRDHARLDLRIMGREVPLGQQEILWVELDKLGKLVAGRVAKLKPQLNHEKTEGLAVH